MTESLRDLAEKEEQLPDGHPDWQHVAFGWRCIALSQRDKIDELEAKLKRATNGMEMFRKDFYRKQREVDQLRRKAQEPAE